MCPGSPEAVRRRRYHGTENVEVVDSGPLFEDTGTPIQALQSGLPLVHHVGNITVESVFDQSVGPRGAARQVSPKSMSESE